MFAKNTPFGQNINLNSLVIDGFYLFLKVFVSNPAVRRFWVFYRFHEPLARRGFRID
jgi:hypothetical protein